MFEMREVREGFHEDYKLLNLHFIPNTIRKRSKNCFVNKYHCDIVEYEADNYLIFRISTFSKFV